MIDGEFMKTYKNLIYNNITLEKCKEIIIKASKHKTKKKSVQKVLNNLDYYANDLYQMVLTDNYTFKQGQKFVVHEYGKDRQIESSPFYPNQCIDYLFLECGFKDIILKKVNFESFGNCPKKGIHKGVKFIHKQLKNNKWRYFMKFDIKKYYENIDLYILYEQIKLIVRDKKFLRLTSAILGRYTKGMPIGSIVSQYLALFYLRGFINDLKVFAKRLNAKLVCNYVDDFLIFGSNKRFLIRLLKNIEINLGDLKLITNKKTIIYSLKERKISMLGYRFQGGIIELRKSILKNLYKHKDKQRYKGWLMWTNCNKLKEKYL